MRALSLSNHSVTIERRRNGDFYAIPKGGSVLPGELIRATTKSDITMGPVEFAVLDPRRNVVFDRKARPNLADNAWVDFTSPVTSGTYSAVASIKTPSWNPFKGFTDRHSADTQFHVSEEAKEPGTGPGQPQPGEGGLKIPNIFSGLQGPAIWVAVILGLILAIQVI